jgi:2-oxo-4-phenylbutanoate reductase
VKLIVSGVKVPKEIDLYAESHSIEIVRFSGNEPIQRLRDAAEDAHYYLLGGDEYIDGEFLSHASNLKAIVVLASGASSFVDLDAASTCGVAIRSTPGANADAVAEFAVGQLLSISRNIAESFRDPFRNSGMTNEIIGSKVGVFGLGAVGGAVARILHNGFGCDVFYTSRTPKYDLESELELRRVSSEELFTECQSIVVCCSLNAETKNSIGSFLLSRGAKNIVGISDIRVFNLVELLNELCAGTFDAVALDASPDLFLSSFPAGITPELVFESGLYLSPHIAAKSHEAWQRMISFGTKELLHMMEME